MKDIKEETIIEEEEKKEHPLLKKIIIISILIIVLSITYINIIGTKVIEVKEYKIASLNLPTSFDGFKVIQISDIHYGTTINNKELNNMVKKINELKPDIILFTGDLIDKNININDTTKEEIIEILSRLECTQYKYAIYGDEDYSNDNYENIMTESDFILLDNESTLLYYKDKTPIMITGISPIDTTPNYNIVSDTIDEIDLTTLYRIILIHEPDAYDNISYSNPDLVLAGHTLGNMIRIPGIENLFTAQNAKKYNKDYNKKNGTDMFISSGLGTSNFKSRINNRPSFNLYRFYKE